MIIHNIKIAFRNMWKHKNQTLISVVGLAVGFACFTMATIWIVYEMTFDNFHKNAKYMYVVSTPHLLHSTDVSTNSFYPLAAYLKETFPEIANATPIHPSYGVGKVKVDNVEFSAMTISVDSSFFQMFDVKILEGTQDFLTNDSKNIAIIWAKARQLFGKEHPIGKKVTIWNEEHTICAIVSEIPKRSNYAFDILSTFSGSERHPEIGWSTYSGNTIIELFPGTNMEAFEKKLYEHETGREKGSINKMTITPITKLRYVDPNIRREVKLQHVLIFSISGLLVVLCSLLNYLTLFVSRFRIRQKELALRMVCGASGRSLLSMLSVEFILTLLFAVLLGGVITQFFIKSFMELSQIQMSISSIYKELFLYVGGVILISFLLFCLILIVFRHRSLNLSIRRNNKKLFRKTSIVFQLLISIGFVFCSVIILKQLHFLHNTDELGFSFKNRGAVMLNQKGISSELASQIKQIPEITDVFAAQGMQDLTRVIVRMSENIYYWDGKPADAEKFSIERFMVSPEYLAYYDFKLVAGEMLNESDPPSLVLVNESAVKAFGWHDPVGKKFDGFEVKGVIRDVYNFTQISKAKPIFYFKPNDYGSGIASIVLFKYKEGTWKSCEAKIEQLIEKEYEQLVEKKFAGLKCIVNSEEEYNKFLKSENTLIKLLSGVSVICVFVSIFGFVSLVSLTCEEQRKSIAIRKIHGASTDNILNIFAKEYFLLLIIGAVIAFPVDFYIMQRWLKQYVKQTDIAAWVYLSILFVLALVIVVSVGWKVYKASNETPCEVVKSE